MFLLDAADVSPVKFVTESINNDGLFRARGRLLREAKILGLEKSQVKRQITKLQSTIRFIRAKLTNKKNPPTPEAKKRFEAQLTRLQRTTALLKNRGTHLDQSFEATINGTVPQLQTISPYLGGQAGNHVRSVYANTSQEISGGATMFSAALGNSGIAKVLDQMGFNPFADSAVSDQQQVELAQNVDQISNQTQENAPHIAA